MGTPLIDDLATVPFSTKKGSVVVLNGSGGIFANDVVEASKTLLTSCNWTLITALAATATISYPTGVPVVPAGSGGGPAGCGGWFVMIDGLAFCPISPGATALGGNCVQWVLGDTETATLNNLVFAISTATSPPKWSATYAANPSGGWIVTIQSAVPGTAQNFASVDADGRFGISSGAMVGGGYVFESEGASVYRLTISGQVVTGGIKGVEFDVEMQLGTPNQGTAEYTIDATSPAQYTLFANPYSYGLFDNATDNGNFGVFSPCIPTNEGFTAAYAVFVVGPGNLVTKTMWDGFYIPCTVCLDAAPRTFGDFYSGPGVLALRPIPGGQAMLTPDGAPFTTCAYLQMAQDLGQVAYVVGKLWDCMVVSDITEPTMQIAGRDYLRISAQTGVAGTNRTSLLFCVNDNGNPSAGAGGSGGSTGTGGSGGGGGSNPVTPTAPAGSGNGSITGTCTATGTPDAYTIEWSSGDYFSSAMVGQTLTITLAYTAHGWVSAGGGGDAGGSKPVVASVTNATLLTVTETLNSSFYSAPFTCP